MKEELLKGLSEEQIAKAKACKNQDELLKLAKKEGIVLTDEQLEAVSGGFCTSTEDKKGPQCPYCKSTNTVIRNLGGFEDTMNPCKFQCNDCNKVF